MPALVAGSPPPAGPAAASAAGTSPPLIAFSLAPSPGSAQPASTSAFAAAVAGLTPVEDTRFGTAESGGLKRIGTMAELEADYRPLQGEYGRDGEVIGGTGRNVINGEVQTYAYGFNAENFVFEPHALRLQATLAGGSYSITLRGDAVRPGFTANAPDAASPVATPLAALRLRPADLTAVEIGDMATAGPSGWMVVTGKDSDAGTITFEAVSSGAKSNVIGYHVTFTKFAFGRLAANVVPGEGATVTFADPLPSSVVPGMRVRTVRRGAGAAGNLGGSDDPKVVSVASDRRSVVFDKPVSFYPVPFGSGDHAGLVFVPGLTSGQIWSKRSYGPQRDGIAAQAIEVEVSFPVMPRWSPDRTYTKAQVEAALASSRGVLFGYFPAIWTYVWRPGEGGVGQDLGNGAAPWSEIDMVELWMRLKLGKVAAGTADWTGNLHGGAFTRKVAAAPFAGSVWQRSVATTENGSANTDVLRLAAALTDGRPHRIGIVWDDAGVTHYLDGVALSESAWSSDTEYPHQLGINLACGMLQGGGPAALFFPHDDAMATGQYLKIHSIKSWERPD